MRRGVLACLFDVCAYSPEQLAVEASGESQVAVLIVALAGFITRSDGAADEEEVALAVGCWAKLLSCSAALHAAVDGAFRAHLDAVLRALRLVAAAAGVADSDGAVAPVAASVLACYRALLARLYHRVPPAACAAAYAAALDGLRSPQRRVALAAAEFWHEMAAKPEAVLDICDEPAGGAAGGALLPTLLGCLVEALVMCDAEVAEVEHEEAPPPEAPPRAADSVDGDASDGSDAGACDFQLWSQRRCVAGALDRLARRLGSGLLAPPGCQGGWFVRTQIAARMQAAEWREQEAAVLALGVIARGCGDGVAHLLPEVVPVMLGACEGDAAVRCAARTAAILWALGRYLPWFGRDGAAFTRYLLLVLRSLHAAHPRVQHGALAAFAAILDWEVEEAAAAAYVQEPGEEGCVAMAAPSAPPGGVGAHFDAVVVHLADCVAAAARGGGGPQAARVVDALGQFLAACGGRVARCPAAQQVLLAPLLGSLLPGAPVDDAHVQPALLRCVLGAMEGGAAPAVAPYFSAVVAHVVAVYGRYCEVRCGGAAPGARGPCAAAARLAVDVAAAVCDYNGPAARPAVAELFRATCYPGSRLDFFDLIFLPIARAAGAGDAGPFDAADVMAAVNFAGERLRPWRDALVPRATATLSGVFPALRCDAPLCNDVLWYCGQLAAAVSGGPDSQPCLQSIAAHVLPVLQQIDWDANLLRNAALAAGKIGWAAPDVLAAAFKDSFLTLMAHLTVVPEYGPLSEKAHAFVGVLRALALDLNVLQGEGCMAALARGLASFADIASNAELLLESVQLLQRVKAALGAERWRVVAAGTFPRAAVARVA
eukprot:TRINITY_DN10401_c0_g3_i2.p1 TRINITY_DN10401_c0_g3~~TRINITY_DN10401_c0_g3_i2.p1  ORF type:complete len:871 (+),score=228.44 TRINITY_DN10401_c0_g3_i2:135-2615(+)